MTNGTVKTEKATVYEVGFHIVPAVSPENLPAEVEAIKAILGKNGATIISEEFPKLRNLAYTITKATGPMRNHYDSAYFGWVKFEGSAESVDAIETAFTADEKILRYLLVKTVRENTLYGNKILPQEKEAAAKEESKDKEHKEPAQPVSQEELDKSIDKLVI